MHLELIILEGTQAGRHIPVAQPPVTFGRSSAAGMSFPLDSFMSGMHLRVQHALSGVILVDLRSSNGTFLNGERISQAMAVPGDVIKIGTLTMKLALSRAAAPGNAAVAEAERPAELASAELTAATNLMQAFRSTPAETVADAALEATTVPVAVQIASRVHPVVEQLRGVELPLFCLADPGADEVIARLLAAATERRGYLYEGGAGGAAESSGPCLVQMDFDSALLEALVEDGWGRGWASFFTSTASFEELREHFGKFYKVQIEAGGVYFRFYHPQVLREFLPVASKAELDAFFGPVGEWLLEAEDGVGILRATNGNDGLQTEVAWAG